MEPGVYKVIDMSSDQFKKIEIDCQLFERCERIIVYGGSYSGKSYMLQSLILRYHEKKNYIWNKK